jgi:recombination protein RecR
VPAPSRNNSDSSRAYPASVDRLIAEFAKLPGVGRRSAERLALHVLKSPKDEALALSTAIADVKTSVRHCLTCYNFAEGDQCAICLDPRRERTQVLVVEQPRDLIALEQTAMYRGLYHVLLGRLAPLDAIGPEHLTIAGLLKRIDDPAVRSFTQSGG